jgi:integrase
MKETKEKNEKRRRGQGRTFQRGDKWWISYYAPDSETGHSVEYRESAGDTEKEANKLLTQRLREVAAHKLGLRMFQGPRQERVMVEELLKDLETDYQMRGRNSLPQLKSHLKHVRDYFGLDRALAVTTDRITQYIVARQRDKAAPATINREVEALQSGFSLAAKANPPKLAFLPHFPSLPEQNARQGFFERGEFNAVMEKLEDQDVRDFCEWFYFTGMRPKEIKSLTWADFSRDTCTIKLQGKDAKTGNPRSIAMEGPLRRIIERRIQARRLDCPFIFHRKGARMGEFRKTWKTACKEAGLTGKLVYDFRRTAVRNMTKAGVPRNIAMKISGHRTEAVFERYNIGTDEDIREAIVKTAAYVESLPAQTNVVPFNAEAKAAK